MVSFIELRDREEEAHFGEKKVNINMVILRSQWNLQVKRPIGSWKIWFVAQERGVGISTLWEY